MYFPVLFILTFLSAKADKDIIPVFLMDDSEVMAHLNVDPNPFSKLSTTYFADIVHDSIKRSEVVIIFVENQFSVEDVSIKDKLGTPYQHLHEGLLKDKVKYFPGVREPYKFLNQIFQPKAYNVFYLRTGMNLQMFDEYFKYFYVFFQDGHNETRAEALRKHDSLMREVYTLVHNVASRGVVAFYTGKINPVVFERIKFVPVAPMSVTVDPGVMVVTDGALFRFVGIYAATPTRRSMFRHIPIVADEKWSRRTLSTRMAFTDFELVFSFSFKSREWRLDYIALEEGGEEVGRKSMDVGAAWNWAYYCGEPIEIVNKRDGSSIVISEYQIQPLRKRARVRAGDKEDSAFYDEETQYSGISSGSGDADSLESFGDSINCGPYFTANILGGLLVSAVCLCILAFGVVIMFDCHTNSRYDDPHGKPLLVQPEDANPL